MNEYLNKDLSSIKKLSQEQFEALFEINRALNADVYRQSLIENVLDIIIDTLKAERSLFARFDDIETKIIAARNSEKKSIEDIKEFSSGVIQKVIELQQPILYHDVQGDPQLSQFHSVQLKNIKSVIGVPVFREKKIWGIILADTQLNRKEFTDSNLVFLQFFSNLVSLALDRIDSVEKLKDENELLANRISTVDKLPDIVGESKAMQELSSIIHKVSRTDATVLLLGESGTGKELVAHAIHQLSARRNKPYLAQFCGSIPESLLESELFGYKKGAFTGAVNDKKGLLEVSESGTFFLDEIGEISPAVQTKLLRVIENREITRLGDTSVRKVDIRLIAATNKNLAALVEDGEFREDLFYRLNVFPVTLPPLRQRYGDIPILARHFLKQFKNNDLIIEPDALKKLEDYNWPGNVRQLINVLQRAAILSETNRIGSEHIHLPEAKISVDFSGTLKDIEKGLLEERLKQYNGNRTHTAHSLGVSVRWVQLKLKELSIE
ncbi:MAG: sigma 54-interacting transcriptional regulator [Ignavibacteriaceae bacterium]|nr:sigma 54-interacting transcriptional regulator [Ignavibacteriaceae bacterium]